MEMFLEMNSSITKRVLMQHTISSSRTISCRANNDLSMQKKKANFYEVLSLESGNNVGFDEIKKAYRSMALQYHPDVYPPSEKEDSTKRFVELREAYETLSDPVSRRRYDYELGLANSIGFHGFERLGLMEERKKSFPKAVWEKQLSGLKQRSRAHMEKKNIQSV